MLTQTFQHKCLIIFKRYSFNKIFNTWEFSHISYTPERNHLPSWSTFISIALPRIGNAAGPGIFSINFTILARFLLKITINRITENIRNSVSGEWYDNIFTVLFRTTLWDRIVSIFSNFYCNTPPKEWNRATIRQRLNRILQKAKKWL